MKKIGIRFELTQTFNTNCLFEILKSLKEEKLSWHIIANQTEIWADKNGKETFLKQEYSTREFFEVISCNHYAIFVKIQVYSSSRNFYELHTKEDFFNSECEMILLICDTDWCDIYIKNPQWIDIIHQSLIQSGFDNVEYIFDKYDKRLKLDIL